MSKCRNQLLLGALLALMLVSGCGRGHESSALPPLPPLAAPPQPKTVAQSKPLVTLRPAVPERLTIPAVDLDVPVVELGWKTSHGGSGSIFSEWDVAAYAAGWHKNSALLGGHGNLVMSGHNNILGAVFRELDQLRRGDLISVGAGDEVAEYIVHDVMIVPEKYASEEQRRQNAAWIGKFPDNRLTLVSCWPRDDNTHRIIVVAFPKAAQ